MLRLSKDVWHGYTHLKGEAITFVGQHLPTVEDAHGCEAGDFLDSHGAPITLWGCEVEQFKDVTVTENNQLRPQSWTEKLETTSLSDHFNHVAELVTHPVTKEELLYFTQVALGDTSFRTFDGIAKAQEIGKRILTQLNEDQEVKRCLEYIFTV